MSEWISVKERLPETGEWMLAWCGNGCSVAAHPFLDGRGWFDTNLLPIFVTHWMPLPTPPEAESEAGET